MLLLLFSLVLNLILLHLLGGGIAGNLFQKGSI